MASRKPLKILIGPAFFELKPEEPEYRPRMGYIPPKKVYISQNGDANGPYDEGRWFYESADGTVYASTCIKTILDDYVPNSYQNNDLLLSLADTYRAATTK